jgi:hypothetical protein
VGRILRTALAVLVTAAAIVAALAMIADAGFV